MCEHVASVKIDVGKGAKEKNKSRPTRVDFRDRRSISVGNGVVAHLVVVMVVLVSATKGKFIYV